MGESIGASYVKENLMSPTWPEERASRAGTTEGRRQQKVIGRRRREPRGDGASRAGLANVWQSYVCCGKRGLGASDATSRVIRLPNVDPA